jgi:hypothetical protein
MATLSEIHTARKRHIPGTPGGGCDVCRNAIEPGQRYERWAATQSGKAGNVPRWSHLKAHHPYGDCIQPAHLARAVGDA